MFSLFVTLDNMFIFEDAFMRLYKAVARGGVPQVHVHPPFQKKQQTKNKQTISYLHCRIIRFYTNNPKCQHVYLSFYLNDYQIIDKVNTI